MTATEIIEKIKLLFNTKEVKVEETELAKPTAPEDMPSNEEIPNEMPKDSANVEDKVAELEAKIAEIEKILTANQLVLDKKDEEMKEKDNKIEELSKQITEKDALVESIKVELSVTPISDDVIQLEKPAKKATFAQRMNDQIKATRAEKGLSY